MCCHEKTNIVGSKAPTPKHSGGHRDTANRRMISHIGCEDGCGYLAQFLSGTFLMQTPYTFSGRTNFKTTKITFRDTTGLFNYF